MPAGIPPGYIAVEHPELRYAEWRFYYINEEADLPSIQEANLPVEKGQAQSGREGLTRFLDQVRQAGHTPDPVVFATQVAMFLIQGDSRQSCIFKIIVDPTQDAKRFVQYHARLHPPKLTIDTVGISLQAWIRRDGYLVSLAVEASAGQPPTITLGRPLSR